MHFSKKCWGLFVLNNKLILRYFKFDHIKKCFTRCWNTRWKREWVMIQFSVTPIANSNSSQIDIDFEVWIVACLSPFCCTVNFVIRSKLRYMLNMSCIIVVSQIWLPFLSLYFTHYWWIMNQRSPISILQGCELCPDILQDYTHLMRSSVPFYRGWLNHEQFIEWRRKFRWNWFWVCFILFTNYKMKVMSLRWLKFDKTWLHHVPLVTLCSPGNTMFPW